MTIKGYQFDRETPTPLSDSRLYHTLGFNWDGVIPDIDDAMSVAVSGQIATISKGACMIKGRYIEISEAHDVVIPQEAADGSCLVITVDLSEQNQSSGVVGSAEYIPINNQVRAEVVPTVVQEDIKNDGLIYMLPLGQLSNATGTWSFMRANGSYISGAQSLLSKIYPIGSLYFNAGSDVNPSTLLGFGTWVAIGGGRAIIGAGSNGVTDYDRGDIGGVESVAITAAQLAAHTHTQNSHNHTQQPHAHSVYSGFAAEQGSKKDSLGFCSRTQSVANGGSGYRLYGFGSQFIENKTAANNATTAANNNTGDNQAHENRMPYLTVCIWQRTA